ncbi:MAG: hypothetical protein ACKV2Q_32800 [Planctomycetaceae bacterium]
MTTFEATVFVPADRRVVLQVPDNVSPGQHRVRIQIDPVANSSSVDLAAQGIDERQAADLRSRQGTIVEDWDRPEAGFTMSHDRGDGPNTSIHSFQVRSFCICIYSEGVASHSPGLPRIAATLG